MNARLIAAALRDLAAAIEAEEEDGGGKAPAPAEEPVSPRARRVAAPPAPPRLVRPDGENDELARRKAQTFLRRNGYTKAAR